jgi:ribonuclease HII
MSWLKPRIDRQLFTSADDFEEALGAELVVGISVVGESAIAGPICAASVMLAQGKLVKYSEPAAGLTEEHLAKAYASIRQNAIMFQMGWASSLDITTMGLKKAIKMAIGSSLEEISIHSGIDLLILDGTVLDSLPNNIEYCHFPVISIPRASEFIEPTIAASIVAKSARNAVMSLAHEEAPEYDWNNNKGYATPIHLEAIKLSGVTQFHRDLTHLKSLKNDKLFRNPHIKN